MSRTASHDVPSEPVPDAPGKGGAATFFHGSALAPPKLSYAARWYKYAGPVLSILLFLLALAGLYVTLRHLDYREVMVALRQLPPETLVSATLLTALSYLLLTLYDQLGFRYLGRKLPWRQVALASFAGHAFGNVAWHAFVAGAAVRYWIYASLGVPAKQIITIIVFCNVGFWLGYLAVAAPSFLADPLPSPGYFQSLSLWPLGLLFLAGLVGYLALSAKARSIKFIRWSLPVLPLRFTLGQIAIAVVDITVMAAVLWILLPAEQKPSLLHFVQVYMLALIIGAVSQVPGGLGVFESGFLALLPLQYRTSDVVAALLAYRLIYFIAPFLVAALALAFRHAGKHSIVLYKTSAVLGRGVAAAAPQLLAIAVFAAGAVLLFSGALPSSGGRLNWLVQLESLPIIEASHFIASIVGVALLLLARGLQRRLDAAYLLAVALLAAGIVLSLAKGFDYEEAGILAIMLGLLLPNRAQFYRRASLLADPLSRGWLVSIVIVLCGSLWLYAFSFKHIEYSHELWWRFALSAEAPRAMRATVGAICLAVAFSAAYLLKPVRPQLSLADDSAIEQARAVVAASTWTYANLVFRRDKALMFSSSRNAFLMYRRQGKSWITMGDPIGSKDEAAELIWKFRGLCDRYDGWPVFFEVRPDNLPLYLDLGLELNKLGEEARVDLADFDLAGAKYAGLRQSRSKLTRLGCHFEIVQACAVPDILPQIARVSDSWLGKKTAREKGFSNASFDIGYLRQFPVAVVRRRDTIIAFANLWLGAGREELSVDLMRHMADAPRGTMDYLFVELMGWGRQQGYRWFNFGMAPLSGLVPVPGAPLWNRFGGLIYQYGGHFYNFQGLRHYKDKFNPVWSPRYLASPGGLVLPAVLLDVSTLIAGGVTGILAK